MYFRNRKKSAQDVYISDPIDTDKDGNALTLQDIMADDTCIFDDIELRLRAEQLHRCIEQSLAGREREIVVLRYGLNGKRPLTQREVASRLEISRSYVSRLEKKALEKRRAELGKCGKERKIQRQQRRVFGGGLFRRQRLSAVCPPKGRGGQLVFSAVSNEHCSPEGCSAGFPVPGEYVFYCAAQFR